MAEFEYCNLKIIFERSFIEKSILEWKQDFQLEQASSPGYIIFTLKSNKKTIKLKFKKEQSYFRLMGTYFIRDQHFISLFEHFIQASYGQAIRKQITPHGSVIDTYYFGEKIKSVCITGTQKHLLFEKEIPFTMADVENAYLSLDALSRIYTLRFEIDYELASLSDALSIHDEKAAAYHRKRLEELHQQALILEMY